MMLGWTGQTDGYAYEPVKLVPKKNTWSLFTAIADVLSLQLTLEHISFPDNEKMVRYDHEHESVTSHPYEKYDRPTIRRHLTVQLMPSGHLKYILHCNSPIIPWENFPATVTWKIPLSTTLTKLVMKCEAWSLNFNLLAL